MWTSLEIIKIVIPLVTPFVIVILTFYLKHIYDKKERRHKSRIELTIGANFFGPQEGYYLAEFIVTIYNKSFIQHKFNMLNLSVHGIKKDTKIEPWVKQDRDKAYFPEEILGKKSLIPDTEDTKWNYIFVEPGVKQNVTLITRVPEDIRYVLAHVKFEYDPKTPHTAERMFELKPSQPETQNI